MELFGSLSQYPDFSLEDKVVPLAHVNDRVHNTRKDVFLGQGVERPKILIVFA